ncbi:MAG: methylmalonyl-CoA mutase, partial [Actinobacteria bacterium]|nr:methylmalonyl-CoA mutase [Actinomycetota bacterium]
MEEGKKIAEEEEKWRLRTESGRERKDRFESDAGIPLKSLYTPNDVQSVEYLRDVGFPGQPPYTRGVYPNMYRGRLWTIRMFSGFGTPEETNKRWK